MPSDEFDFVGGGDSPAAAAAGGAAHDVSRQVARCLPKLRGSSKASQLKVLAGLLEQVPQDVASLGPGSARDALLEALSERPILHSKQKDVRMYAAACYAQLLRIYAPDTPWGDDKQLEPVFELLLWSVEQVGEHRAPTYELAVSVLQTISQTKSYILLLDTADCEHLVLEWVRVLLTCVKAGNSALVGPHVLEVLTGLVGDEDTSEDVLELLLSHLVPPNSTDNPLACQMVQAVLKACEGAIKPALQKFLTELIQSPITANSDLHQQCYALIYQLYLAVPHVLLPVMPHLTHELGCEDGDKRLEATQLLGRLLSLPGNRLVCEYSDVLETLLKRYSDALIPIRLAMLEFTPALVAAAGSEALQKQVLSAAAERLQDFEEKVRVAAVKAVCSTARQLLVGPAPSGAGGAGGGGGSGSGNAAGLLSPIDALLGSMGGGSQEEVAAAAADLGLADLPGWQQGAAATPGAAAAAVRDVAFVHELLKHVAMRMRDVKAAVRKAAATQLVTIFRAVVAAGDAAQVSRCCWLAARVIICSKSDPDVRGALIELTGQHGLMGPRTPPGVAAAAWARLWLACSNLEREALAPLLQARQTVQVGALQLLAQRRKLSGRAAAAAAAAAGGGDDNEEEATRRQAQLDAAVRQLARRLPHPDKQVECLTQLMAVRDNHAFTALQQALAPGTSQEGCTKARADALARVGSRTPAAEAVNALLLWGRPAAWLPSPLVAALLELAADDPGGEQGELVAGAYELLTMVSKHASVVFAGLLDQLHSQLVCSAEPDLQELGVRALGHCAAQLRKCSMPLSASPDAATAALVTQQLLPALRSICRGRAPRRPAADGSQDAAADSNAEDAEGDAAAAGLGSQAAGVSPKAAKWAVYALAACQETSRSKRELEQLADLLVGSLDASAADTGAKLQALGMVGRLYPEAFGRHVEALLHFVTEDYFLAYLDAAAGGGGGGGGAGDTAAAGSGGGSGGRRRRSLGGGTPSQADSMLGGGGSQGGDAAAVGLKGAALRALAGGCVPDSDSHELPVATLRAVVRLSQFLEGLLEPGEEDRPAFLSDASPELCGQLRLAAAASLLRLARRHDARLATSTYCALALVMQDECQAVRGAFADKVYRLLRHTQGRSHQLSAKYAAMLPLGAADPYRPNKVQAGRYLRTWVHDRRAAVAAMTLSAATGRAERDGGSTLQHMPEMMVPYGLYVLGHHPDFPQDEDADDPDSYEAFQFMLQFMLQPLLVASGTLPGGATLSVLLKLCRTLKLTSDTAEVPATVQLHCLCDMASATLQALAGIMQLPAAGDYPGSIVLPKGLFKPIDKADRGADLSFLPPGFEVVMDPEPVVALSAPPHNAAGGGGPGGGRGTKSKAGGGGGAGRGRGSKRKAAGSAREAAGESAGAGGNEGGRKHKRSRGGRGGGGARGSGRKRTAAAADSDDDGWGPDSDMDEDAPPSAAKADQLTHRQQVLAQQKVQQQQQQQQAATSADDGSMDVDGGDDAADAQGAGNRAPRQQQQQQPKQRQLKQQPISFAAPAAAVADASSPAPAKCSRHQAAAAAAEDSGGDGGASSSQHDAQEEDEGGDAGGSSPAPPAAANKGRRAAGGAAAAPAAVARKGKGGGSRKQQRGDDKENEGAAEVAAAAAQPGKKAGKAAARGTQAGGAAAVAGGRATRSGKRAAVA